jgi:protein transport protein SEC24
MGQPGAQQPPPPQQMNQGYAAPPPPMGGAGIPDAFGGGGGGGGGYQVPPPPQGGQAPGGKFYSSQGAPPPPPPTQGGGQQQGQYQQGQQQQQQQYPGPPPPQGGQYPPPQQGQPGQQQQQQQQQQSIHPPPGGQYQQMHAPQVQGAPAFRYDPNDSEQAQPAFMRMSVNAFPASSQLLGRWTLPFGCVIHPLAEVGGEGADAAGGSEVDVINFGASGIIRCRACRTYINPFVRWVEGGRKWVCNMCGMPNNVPTDYYCNVDPATGKRHDHNERPELSKGSCEFIAPLEYMVRPPQAPVYCFVIDTSYNAVQSGMLAVACQTIAACLDNLPGEPRTQVAFITFSSKVHFFNLKATLSAPQVLVCPDVDDVFPPLPEDLLVNLQESRGLVDQLLQLLPTLAAPSATDRPDVEAALGPALQAAQTLMRPIGGKMVVLSASLPSLGAGRLRAREDPKALGTDREQELLQPADPLYKTLAVECVRQQISIDLFCFGHGYNDFATLGCLPRYTCGQGYYYPGFSGRTDGAKFRAELTRLLTRGTGFEAVMRVRLSRGLRITNFFGHYFVRGSDLLSLPNVDADKAFGIEVGFEDATLGGETRACVQAAVLYTTSSGERRIRVHTICLPVTNNIADMYKYADVETTVNLSAKIAINDAVATKLPGARERLKANMITALRTYLQTAGGRPGGAGANQLVLPETLKLLPLYTLGLQKSPPLSATPGLRTDARAHAMMQLSLMSVTEGMRYIHPRLFNITDLVFDSTGSLGDDGRVVLPPLVSLSAQQLSDQGALLLDDAVTLRLWLGRSVNPAFVQKVLGFESLQGVDPSQVVVELQDNDVSRRFAAVVGAIRGRSGIHQQIHIVLQQSPQEAAFLDRLIEDRNRWAMGYLEFLSHVHQQVSR